MSQARLIASDVLDCALITYQVSILCRSQMRNWSYIGSWRPGKKQCTAQNKDRIRQNSQQSPSICLSLRAEKFSKHQIEQGRSEEESGFSVWVTYFETRAWTCGEGVLVLRWCLRRVPYSECVDIYKFIHATSAEIKYSYHSIWTATCFEGMQRSRCTSMCDTGHVRQCTTTLCKHTTSQCIVLNFEASPWWRNISVLRANSGLHHMVKQRRQWLAKPMRQIGSLD